MTARAAVILAAGQGTRMKSPTPKVLHTVGARTLVDHAIDTAEALGCERIIVVCGTHSPAVGARVAARLGPAAVAIQDPPQGTGHAVRCAEAALADFDGDVVVTYADGPLLTAPYVARLFDLRAKGCDIAVLGFDAANPAGYGRLILTPSGELLRIVEEKDADDTVRQVKHCNSGVLAADRVAVDGRAHEAGDVDRGEHVGREDPAAGGGEREVLGRQAGRAPAQERERVGELGAGDEAAHAGIMAHGSGVEGRFGGGAGDRCGGTGTRRRRQVGEGGARSEVARGTGA